jgi:hypothetical protein
VRCQFALTFEFDGKAPTVTKGVAEGFALATVAKRALQVATNDHRHSLWRSLVLVLEKETPDDQNPTDT